MKSQILTNRVREVHNSLLSLVLVLLLFSLNAYSQQLSFPSAIGAGAYTSGGRGGEVIKVTNLNNSGPGSLRAALTSTGPRIIVFDVSGTIHLTSMIELTLAQSNFTVAGQTAPEGGITIAGKPIQLGGGYNQANQPCNNAVFRYIRFRNASYTGVDDAYMHNAFISSGTDGLVFDHCSFSFNDDQAISMRSIYGALANITVQNCMFSENATAIIAGYVDDTYATGDMTFVNNLFVDQSHRTPNIGGSLQFDVVNNVYYNWVSRLTNANCQSPDINFVGNYMKPGSYSSNTSVNKVQSVVPSIYSANNYHENLYPTPQTNDYNLWQNFYNGSDLPANYFAPTQFPLLGNQFEVLTPFDAYDSVLANVGTNKYLNGDGTSSEYQDSYDILKISNVINDISSDPYNHNWVLPALPNNTRSADFDTNDDGMPDAWKIAKGFDADTDLSSHEWGSGYIGIEEYLNEIDGPSVPVEVVANAGEDVEICEGESIELTANGGVNFLWSNGATTQTITVSPNETTSYSVTVSNADNSSSDTDDVLVAVNNLPEIELGEDQTICFGDTITLVGPEADSYLWSTGETTQSISISPTGDTIYTLEITLNNCSEIDDVEIFVSELPDVNAGTDQTINVGESITLQASGADSYVWSTGEETAQIEVSPVVTTTYTVTGLVNTCENTDTITVFIEETIEADAGEDVTICNGSSTTLTASGGDVYLWNTGEETASIVVSPNYDSVYSVTVSNSEGSASDIDDVEVFVTELPVADAGDDVEICEGESVVLTAQGSGEFLWSTGETSQSISVQPEETTVYTVIVSQNDCNDQDEVTVVVNAIPQLVLSEDITITDGDIVVLTVSGAENYLWDTGATTSSISVSPTTTTTYFVSGFNGNCEVSDSVTVFVDNTVVADAGDDVEICQGESVSLTANGGVSYLWNTGETTQTILVNPEITTTYQVTVFNASETSSDSDDVNVTVSAIPDLDLGDDLETCQGQSVTLTAQGSGTFLWSTGETSSSIEVNPESTTIYSVILENSSCSAYDEIQVVVHAIPNINAGENQTIYLGDTAELIASGGNNYTWSNGMTGSNINVSPVETTTYIVTGYSNGCENSDAITVFVETPIVADAGPDVHICEGYDTVLTAYGGSSYLWSTGETTQSIVVSPNYSQTYSVTVYEGDNQASDDVIVHVNQNPEIEVLNSEEELVIDNGEYISLSVSGADSYLWSNGATQPNIAVNPSSTTTYWVTGYINQCSSQKEVTVIVKEPVLAFAGEDTTICRGESTILTASGGETYLWNTGETTQSIEVTPEYLTEYSVRAYDIYGDFDDDAVSVYVDICESLGPPNDALESALDVYPNPTTGIVNVRIKGYKNLRGMYLYDISGKLLYSESFENAYSAQQIEVTKQLNLSKYQAGVYLLQLVDGVNTITKKVVVAN